MRKKKLSLQQQKRIKLRQTKQKDDYLADNTPVEKGLVLAQYSRKVDVLAISTQQIIRCHLRNNLQPLTVGDRVTWQQTQDNKGVITAVLERKSVLLRPDGLGQLKPVAANIDHIYLVIAQDPSPQPHLIDRYLVAAEQIGIPVSFVMNKIDLGYIDPLQPLFAYYEKLGYPIFPVSTKTQLGLAELRSHMVAKTSILVGQSGVGKSSLINTLVDQAHAKIGALSSGKTKGKHTTSQSTLFLFNDEGGIIDSPGIREFHLTHLKRAEVYLGYRELHTLLGKCRYRNCQHEEEPGCAIKSFMLEGDMPVSRQQSLHYILNNST